MYLTTASWLCMSTLVMGFTNVVSVVNVCSSHSRAMVSFESDGSAAIFPKACQLDCAISEPHQLRLSPMFATPARPTMLVIVGASVADDLWQGVFVQGDVVFFSLVAQHERVNWQMLS